MSALTNRAKPGSSGSPKPIAVGNGWSMRITTFSGISVSKVMEYQEADRIDIRRLMAERFPDRKLPGFVLSLIKKIVHQEDINSLFANASGRKNLDFINSCMEQLRFTCRVTGEQHLPVDGRRLVFACNHP
jgi:hypothetical protein